jgi:predicted DNA-binding protein
VVARKTAKKIAAKDADQYMLRLPPGLRERVARRAAENGRSMNTEIIEAVEKHLRDADRITQIWEFFESNRKDIEQIPRIWDSIENLENAVGGLTTFRSLRRPWDDAQQAGGTPITADQAQKIRALLNETGASQSLFLMQLRASSVENISAFAFERAISILEGYSRKK